MMAHLRPVKIHYSSGEITQASFVHTAVLAATKRLINGTSKRAQVFLDGQYVALVYKATKPFVGIVWFPNDRWIK